MKKKRDHEFEREQVGGIWEGLEGRKGRRKTVNRVLSMKEFGETLTRCMLTACGRECFKDFKKKKVPER